MIWEIDPAHSQVSFAIRVMSLATTRGHFNRLRGHLHIDEQNPTSPWVEAEVDAASIDTHHLLRDIHLRSKSFFGVKKYPTIAFRSTHVEHASGTAYKVTGNLTLHGRTQPITFDVEYGSQSSGLETHVRFTAKAAMNRKDFGLGQGMLGRFVASDRVAIEMAVVAVQPSMQVPEVVARVE